MAVSTDERREIAARLRNAEIYKLGLSYSAHLGEAIGECVRLVSGHECFIEGGLNRLADLIEPEPERTCRPSNKCGFPTCECGEVFKDFNLPNYCPNCGCRVREGE